jgi:hypothetical protein
MRISSLTALLVIAAVCAPGSSAGAQEGKTAKTRKPPSICVGLDESACGDKAVCYWRAATTTKTGKTRRAHCRIKRSASGNEPT